MQRCPECGIRLKSNYCDICMRRVPLKKAPVKTTFQYEKGSSAHAEEKRHDCIDFEMPRQVQEPQHVPARPVSKEKNAKKGVKAVSIVIAALSVFSSVFGLFESAGEREPEYNYEAYQIDGSVPQIAQTTLYDDGEISILVDSVGLYYGDYAVSLMIQNDSDMDIVVDTDSLSVNGYMLSSGLYAGVDAGETLQAFLSFDSYEMEKAEITQVAEAEFYLRIYDDDTYDDIAYTELITLRTDLEDYVQPVDLSGWELYQDENVRVVLRAMELSSYGDFDLDLYVENLSEQEVTMSVSTVRINGEEVEGFLWSALRPHTRAIDSVYIHDLEEMEITAQEDITEITLDLHIECGQDGYIEESVNETVTIIPSELN